MILVIDIGNTTIEFGIYNESELIGVFRLGSKRDISSDEVGLFASQFFDYRHIAMSAISDVVISSVVPQLNYSVTNAIKKYFGLDPYVIGEENVCCGHTLVYDEEAGQYICESCGETYEAE